MERQLSWRVLLCTKPLIIVLPEQDYPTYCKFVIECVYWNAAPERIVNQNFHLFYLCYDVFLVELCGLCRDGLTVPSNSSSFEVPHAAFWSVFVTWGMVKEFSSTLLLRRFTRELPSHSAIHKYQTVQNSQQAVGRWCIVTSCRVIRRSKPDVTEHAVHGSWLSLLYMVLHE